MKAIDRRLRRIEELIPVPPCGHELAFLRDPTEAEIEKVQKELSACPQCSQPRGGPAIVILRTFQKPEEKPSQRPVVISLTENPSGDERPKITFSTYGD